jgi:hypothetical protein
MAVKNYSIPLNDQSSQSGDRTFKSFRDAGTSVEFKLTHVTPADKNELNLITSYKGTVTNHVYSASISGGEATVVLSSAQISNVYADADGGDWDYVQAQWTVGVVDSGGKSQLLATQNSTVYDSYGWGS